MAFVLHVIQYWPALLDCFLGYKSILISQTKTVSTDLPPHLSVKDCLCS